MAGYDDRAKAIHRGFFGTAVSDSLGPYPSVRTPRWDSFMTNDHSPVGRGLMSRARPRTRSYAQGLDLSWGRHFLQNYDIDEGVSSSQTFSAFDLENDGSTTVKSYFIPTVKASSLGISNLDLLAQRCHAPTEQPAVEIVAIDCVNAADSRVKVYIRSKNTTFGSMMDVVSLCGRLPFLTDTVMSSLKELWVAVFGSGAEDDAGALSRPLPTIHHRTSRIILPRAEPDAPLPKPKVYLPDRHYAREDDQVARGSSGFLERRGKSSANGVTYYEGVKSL
ncbi:4-O-dimethylallyl-L-tyrosine synthase [Colletotrichum gloeosporioides]|uniref:4-O-dimethylallyl-L-tyrosine synthase n=1 Tax=Colletotrichum gloeosporioides TaxID=474922 RepID=A0A8H4FEK1_COLGL|nr:4-O-dimethylallyl-L-tyrosine synthase [Colletotrichum gloeosporioides]KAF3799458.1 4-O-dimethylallyl-L-tyrosine synthase [Colletotrichum gloeosporioides]